MTLKELEIGKSAVIQTVGGEGALRQHILDMGLIPGVKITMVKFAPLGDPVELRVHSYELHGEAADLSVFCEYFLPAVQRPDCGAAVFSRDCGGNTGRVSL